MQESRSRAVTLLYTVGNVKCEVMVHFQTGLHFISVVSCPIETKVCKRAETLSVSKTVNNKDKFMALHQQKTRYASLHITLGALVSLSILVGITSHLETI